MQISFLNSTLWRLPWKPPYVVAGFRRLERRVTIKGRLPYRTEITFGLILASNSTTLVCTTVSMVATEGDAALRTWVNAECHVAMIKKTFCRIGGESLCCWWLAGCESLRDKTTQSRLENALKSQKILHCESSTGPYLTASVGYASITSDQHQFDFDLLYGKADKALYQKSQRFGGEKSIVSALKRKKSLTVSLS